MDPEAPEGVTITGDSNLLELIGKTAVNGTLTLDQIEWIQPSQDLIIKIGAPKIEALEHGTHDTTYVINLNAEQFSVEANVGLVILSGNVERLNVESKLATINASSLKANNATVNISSRGSATVNVSNKLETQLDEDASLKLFTEPKVITGNYQAPQTATAPVEIPDYISFKIKNNSWNRRNFYVEGPNQDGSSFSYGFPIMPGFSRAERWTVGTKIYLDKAVGKGKLLHTVTAQDEGATIKLFQ
ncbi:GIN domain-containing protein [Gilvibacter sp.]|uniref:GIN domain-containing protein n=1 Tax=Gilvibacter sp. TaxID=2729997 RepID=UPI003F4A73AA